MHSGQGLKNEKKGLKTFKTLVGTLCYQDASLEKKCYNVNFKGHASI